MQDNLLEEKIVWLESFLAIYNQACPFIDTMTSVDSNGQPTKGEKILEPYQNLNPLYLALKSMPTPSDKKLRKVRDDLDKTLFNCVKAGEMTLKMLDDANHGAKFASRMHYATIVGHINIASTWRNDLVKYLAEVNVPKAVNTEYQECLDYFEAETKVIAFQTKEADIYNNAMVKYGNSVTENPLAAKEACKAANRLSQAAIEVVRRHDALKPVPIAASAVHYAWHLTLLANATWASATFSAIEAMAEGMTPNMNYVQQLVKEYQKAGKSAQKEDKNFLKRLKVSADEIADIVSRATALDSDADDWEPELPD